MSDSVLSYKCPSCGDSLRYGADNGTLVCDACGCEYSPEAIHKYYETEKDTSEFDWGAYKEQFSADAERLDGTVTYTCRSCGAEIETTETTVATHCPYCDNEVVISDRIRGGIRPNAIIPFKIDQKGLRDSVLAYFKGRKLLPRNFADEQKMSAVQGLYVPFWLFDSGIGGRMNYNGTTVRYFSDMTYNYTETRHFLITLDGDMNFEKIPVDGSRKMDDDLMDSLEPFDFSELVDFDSAYLSGFLADRFDDDPDSSLPRASERMKNSAEAEFRGSVGAEFTSATKRSENLSLSSPSVKYVLLPVYLLNLDYKGKKYRFAVNGQTGKVVGELPISRLKKNLYFWGITAAVTAVLNLILLLLTV